MITLDWTTEPDGTRTAVKGGERFTLRPIRRQWKIEAPFASFHESLARSTELAEERIDRYLREQRLPPKEAADLPLEALVARLRYDGVFTTVRAYLTATQDAARAGKLFSESRTAAESLVVLVRGDVDAELLARHRRLAGRYLPQGVLHTALAGRFYLVRWPE
jgi:hypothetical protein